MKKLLFIISIIIFTCSFSFAQSGWFPLNSGTSEILFSVFFTDANTGYATGFNGAALKTTNAGVNWFSQTVPTTYQLRYVFFTDVNTGYIASGLSTAEGDVFKTTNGGNSWNALLLPNYAHFYRVYFINSNTGYVTGWETILKTTNAGITWESQTFAGLGFISHIYFVDVTTGFACTLNSNKIFKTTNAGTNWQEVFTNSGNIGFFGISFINANTGTAVGGLPSTPGSAFMFRTTNGGINWTNYIFNNSNIPRLYSISFLSPSIGYIAGGGMAGGNCTIMKTTNGGVDWYFQTTNVNNGLVGNYFTSINTGYVVGYGGTILKTTDGGGTLLGINPESNQIPSQYSLSQNYPNPFNPSTNIKYQMPKNSFVSLKVYDVLGKEVATLVNEKLNAGNYEVDWNGSDYPSGVYIYKLVAGDFVNVKKMVLLK